MQQSSHKKLRFYLLILWSIALLSVLYGIYVLEFSTTSSINKIALISQHSGRVQLRKTGSQLWMNVSKNQGIAPGDRIATLIDSSAEIYFDSGHKILLGENSQVVIEEILDKGFKQLKINLISGALEATNPQTSPNANRNNSISSMPVNISSFEIVSKNEVFSLSDKIKSIGISSKNSDRKATIFKLEDGENQTPELETSPNQTTSPKLSPFDLSLSAKLSQSIQKGSIEGSKRQLFDSGFEPELKNKSKIYWSYDFKNQTDIKSIAVELISSQKKSRVENWNPHILFSQLNAKKYSIKLSAREGDQDSIVISDSHLKKYATHHQSITQLTFKLGASYTLNGENIESTKSNVEEVILRSLTLPFAKSFTIRFDKILNSARRQPWYHESNTDQNLVHHLHLYDGRLFPRAALAIKGLNEFRIDENTMQIPQSATFIVKGNKIIGHFTGLKLHKKEYKRFLDLFGADVIFSGSSDAFIQNFSIENEDTFSAGGKKLFILSKGKLIDFSASFLHKQARLLSFMADQKNIIFGQPVKILAAKR